jgi:hypothetical protein
MNEGSPLPPSKETEDKQSRERAIGLAKELFASQERFPFPGLEPESYAALKAIAEEFPEYSPPVDALLERFKNEGMKVVLGKDPGSGNIYILPAQSDDIREDSIFPRHFLVSADMDERIKRLIEMSKQINWLK